MGSGGSKYNPLAAPPGQHATSPHHAQAVPPPPIFTKPRKIIQLPSLARMMLLVALFALCFAVCVAAPALAQDTAPLEEALTGAQADFDMIELDAADEKLSDAIKYAKEAVTCRCDMAFDAVETGTATIQRILEMADRIVPGHFPELIKSGTTFIWEEAAEFALMVR